jgi:hypothetical protein
LLSLKHRFIFVHVPKTGGNAVQNVLRDFSEDQITADFPGQDGVERFGVNSPSYGLSKHAPLAAYRDALGSNQFGRMFKFACIRNPWDRLISFYFSPHRGVRKWDREGFLQLIGDIPPIATHLCMPDAPTTLPYVQPLTDSVQNLDFLMRFESLEADFATVCEKIGITGRPLPHRNRSERAHYSRYYDEELRELVARKYQEEIILGEYEFRGG